MQIKMRDDAHQSDLAIEGEHFDRGEVKSIADDVLAAEILTNPNFERVPESAPAAALSPIASVIKIAPAADAAPVPDKI